MASERVPITNKTRHEAVIRAGLATSDMDGVMAKIPIETFWHPNQLGKIGPSRTAEPLQVEGARESIEIVNLDSRAFLVLSCPWAWTISRAWFLGTPARHPRWTVLGHPKHFKLALRFSTTIRPLRNRLGVPLALPSGGASRPLAPASQCQDHRPLGVTWNGL